jgi:hypothetical protein
MPPISSVSKAGAFPLVGPVTYLHADLEEVRAHLHRGECPPPTVWFHATTEASACAAAKEGLVPSCWCAGDSCCVFGYSSRDEVPRWHRADWIIEIESRALPGQLKAWWVPPQAIRGAWHEDRFYSRAELAARAVASATVGATCQCELHELTREQIARWRSLGGC